MKFKLEKDIHHILISKFLAKESSEDESRELSKWIASSPDNKQHFEEMRALWNETIVTDKINNQNSVLEKLMSDINKDLSGRSDSHTRGWVGIYYKTMVAASLVIIMVIGYHQYQSQRPQGDVPIVGVQDIIKSNPLGQKSKIFLPDGSNIWLNAESTISYASNFGDSARIISLLGEAYFEVAKNAIPFVVQYKDLKVTALGTSFNVAAYPKEEKIVVALVEGKVAVQNGIIEELLNPNEMLIIENKDNKGRKIRGNALEFSSWKDGILIFQSDSLHQIIAKIERWYGVDVVVVGSPDDNLRFTGRFQNEYLNNILESMSYGQKMQYQIKNKNVKIIFN